MNNFPIKTKLFALAGLISVCLLILAAISIHSFSKVTHLNETRLLLQKSSTDILLLRKNEKDFLARLDLEYQRKFDTNLGVLLKELRQLGNNIQSMDLQEESPVASLIHYMQAYSTSFHELVNLYQEIGLTHDSGLRGHLRYAVHQAEAELKTLHQTQLTADMLMLRRNEKDFMLRKLPKYIDKFNKNYAIFNRHLAASAISQQNQKLITDKMTTYHAGFIALSRGYKQLGLTPQSGLQGKMGSTIHKTESVFSSLNQTLVAKLASLSQKIKTKFLIFSGIALCIIVGLLLAISSSVNSRIAYFKNHLADIALKKGDLSTSLQLTGDDEITEISQLFNQFIANLKKTFQQIPQFTHRLDEVSTTNVNVSEKTQQLSSTQQQESEQVVSAMQQMLAAANEIAVNITNAAHSAEEANEEALNGKHSIQAVGTSIDALAKSLKESTGVTQDLEENSNNISMVMEVIQGIAEQTNLLALNAAIEAARAGEQGRGFAVVADEVRTLAQRTQDSTQQIQTLIEVLQTNVKNTVAIMQTGSTSATNTAENALAAIQTLDKISRSVSKIFELNSSIASAAEEQSAVSSNVNTHIMHIDELAKETVSQSIKATDSSHQIHSIAVDLHRLIAGYKF